MNLSATDRLFGSAADRQLFEAAYYGATGPARMHPQLAVPRFFRQPHSHPELAAAAREAQQQRLAAQRLPDNSELRRLWEVLTAQADSVTEALEALPPATAALATATTATPAPAEAATATATLKLSYAQFKACASLVAQHTQKFQPFFQPSVFFRLRRDQLQRISANQFFDLVMRQVSVNHMRLSFCAYDTSGEGWVREKDLEQFVMDHIASMPRLSALDASFYQTYAVYAARKFMFMLDPQRLGKIRVTELLTSDIINEFNELLEDQLPSGYEESNWFSMAMVTRVHGNFVKLDVDENSLLSRAEFASYARGSLTSATLNRIFAISRNYQGQLDYKSYLDFVLATYYPQRPASFKYMFRLLDIDQQGYLSPETIYYFWQSMLKHPRMAEVADPIAFSDISAEIFDMVQPKEQCKITLDDLMRCGQGEIVVQILTDIEGFFAYETRESGG